MAKNKLSANVPPISKFESVEECGKHLQACLDREELKEMVITKVQK